MFDQHDKNDIRQISKEVTTEVIKEVMPVLLEQAFDYFASKAINPAFQQMEERMNKRFDKVENRLDKVERELMSVESGIQLRPTTAIVTHMLEATEERLKRDLGDRPLERDRILDRKTNTVAFTLKDKRIFTSEEVHTIERISPVAVQSVSQ